MDSKAIVDSLKIPFKPNSQTVLVKPLDRIKVKKTITRPTGEEDEDGVMQVEEVETAVESNFQLAVLLTPTTGYEVGDTIVYPNKQVTMPFDLYRDALIMKAYDIMGRWDGEIPKSIDE